VALSGVNPSSYPTPSPCPAFLTVRVGPAPALPRGVAWARSLHLSVPQFPPPLESPRAWKVGGMTRGQCLFQGEFSDLGFPHAPRGGETFFIQHCRGQALVHPLLRSCPRRGPEGMLLLPGILGLAFAWEGAGVAGSVSGSRLPVSEKRQKPQGPAGVCTLHRNLCGCFSKKREWSRSLCVFGMEIRVPRPA
jgi:hypothetical protein